MRTLLATAVLLAIGMVVAGVSAGRALRERDSAVREGILARAAHELERALREAGPEAANETLREFLERTPSVSALELSTTSDTIAGAGIRRGDPIEVPMALGPAWRGLAGGGMRYGTPPFRLRLWPGPGVGNASRLAAVASLGSIVAALALLGFAVAAARGVGARERAAALDAERKRLELVALTGSGLAHRIRNPLATMKATAQILQSRLEGVDGERATRIAEAATRLESLLDELLRFAAPVEPRPQTLELSELALEFTPDVKVIPSLEPVIVRADREHLISAMEELVANARAFDSGTPEMAVMRRGREAVLEVRDRGPGLKIDPRAAFDPYVTTRPDGSGLGLPTIAALIRANGGRVTLENRAGGGCVAAIHLPEAHP
jgi:signal transduction histidine kinase